MRIQDSNLVEVLFISLSSAFITPPFLKFRFEVKRETTKHEFEDGHSLNISPNHAVIFFGHGGLSQRKPS